MRNLLCCAVLGMSLGCGVSITPNAEAVNVTGEVTMASKPVTDVKLNLQVLDMGLPAVIDVVNGKFEAELTPGKYTYFITPGKNANAFKTIPEEYHAGSMEREIEIDAGTALTLTLD